MSRLITGIYTLSIIVMSFAIIQNSHAQTSINYLAADNPPEPETQAKKLLELSKSIQNTDLNISLDVVSKAFDIASKLQNDELLADINHQLGKVSYLLGSTDSGIYKLKTALDFYENKGDKIKSTPVLYDIGMAYFINNQPSKALIFFNSALADYQTMSDSLGIVICNSSIGKVYLQEGKRDDAISNFNNSLQTSLNNNYKIEVIQNYLNLSEALLLDDTTGLVHDYLMKASDLSIIAKNKDLTAKAYLISSKYHRAHNDSIESANNLKEYILLKEKIISEKNEKLQKFLANVVSYNEADKGLNTRYIISGIIVLILLIVILIIVFKLKKQISAHKSRIEKCNIEIEAFNSSLSNLDQKIQDKTKERIEEIEGEIKRNENNEISLNNSQANLSQVNHFKDLFLSKISHEIRTPLSGILGFAEILETQLAIDEENDLFEFAKSITDSGQSLVLLLNNLLDISRLNSNNIKLNINILNTKELIQNVVDKHITEANLKGLKLIYDPTSVPEIQTDNQLFSKILTLILNNSIKFTEKGFIKISQIHNPTDKNITITIKDTGIGIDKVYIEQVFEPYRQESLGYSTSYQGAGLGLPLAKKMATKLGGDIVLESEKGVGTSVIITFPISNVNTEITNPETEVAEAKEPKIESTKPKLPWETLSILVVEDDNMNQLLYKKMLKSAKNLEIAKDGKVALSLVEKHLEGNTFDLVLMDINLPAPWDGISLTKEIRNRWSIYQDIPFIAQTAYAMSGNRESMLEEGFNEYLTKPIIKSTLINTIKKVIVD